MRTLLSILALAAVTGCSNSAKTPATAPATTAPTTAPAGQAGPALAPDGARFAAETKYQGPCVGGRGGCYSYTFQPDGTAVRVLLDANDAGTYTIAGDAVVFRSGAPEAEEVRLATTDGFVTLSGDFRYVP